MTKSSDFKLGYCRVDQEDKIKCDMFHCAAGLGFAGSGSCFLGGEWWNPDCPQYQSEKDFIDSHKNLP